jgi:hypothetical protein
MAIEETLSVAEAAKVLGVGLSTVRRMFDDNPALVGEMIDNGKTGGRERRIFKSWAEAMASVVEERRAAGATPRPPRPRRRPAVPQKLPARGEGGRWVRKTGDGAPPGS